MITFHAPGEKGVDCTQLGACHALIGKAIWIDLFEPTEQEEIVVEATFGIDVPTRREMQEIEVSRRLYKEDESLFMTATILTKADSTEPESTAVTFILAEDRLITVRYADPIPFRTFRKERESDRAFDSGPKMLEGLLDTIIDRAADILENAGADLDRVSREIFITPEQSKVTVGKGKAQRNARDRRDYGEVLRRIGRTSDLVSRTRESLVSLDRLVSFLIQSHKMPTAELAAHFRTLTRDLDSLSDHASFLSSKVNFLLDATLGLINIEQNTIIKIFTIGAVFFLPPTVVGTIYGMNFEGMPELKWSLGYPLALFLMLLSALAPFFYFKRRGWF